MRTIRLDAPPVPDIQITDDLIQRSYSIKIITPVFGGGHEAGFVETDDAVLIRGTSVRGHLRFWWRATTGSQFDNTNDLFQREGDIWGTSKEPSRVTIDLKIVSSKKENYLDSNKKFVSGYPQYALFPFQSLNKDDLTRNCITELNCIVHVSCPKEKLEEVESALYAWVNFGGIGARTRRGCGALYCEELAPDCLSDLRKWYTQTFSHKLGTRKWPTLPDGFLWKTQQDSNPVKAWNDLISLLKKFRQEYPVGRNQGKTPRPGRSRWPEPESIRKVTVGWKGKHKRMKDIPDDAFPRAEFGLPIIFQFPGEPVPQTTLFPFVDGVERTRMSSPLILRPLQCKNGEVAQIIMRLNTEELNEVVLTTEQRNHRSKNIRNPDLSKYPGSPMRRSGSPRSSKGSALEAFLAYAQERENSFSEVRR